MNILISEQSFLTLLKSGTLFFIGIVMALLCAFLIISIFREFASMKIAMLVLLASLSMAGLYFGADAFHTIKIDTKTKTIESSYFGISKKINDSFEYGNWHMYSNHSKLENLVLISSSGKRITFNQSEFTNYAILKDAVNKMGRFNDTMGLQIASSFLKSLGAFLLFLFSLAGLIKLILVFVKK